MDTLEFDRFNPDFIIILGNHHRRQEKRGKERRKRERERERSKKFLKNFISSYLIKFYFAFSNVKVILGKINFLEALNLKSI